MKEIEAKRDLLLRKAIDDRLDDLVQKAQGLVDDKGVAARQSRLKKKQFDNVLGVATETGSVEVVKNFIRYQIGRAGGQGWRYSKKKGEEGFGLAVVAEIDGWLKGTAGEIAEELTKHGVTVPLQEVWRDLVRLYLGYMRRWFVFRHWEEEERRGG